MILRQDLLTSASPAGLQVYQLTSEGVPSSHLYMEAQVVSPDSKRLLVHRSAHAHGSDKHDPEHQYLVCDLDSGGAFLPLTTEVGATAPSVSPDGKWVYYFVNETEVGGGRLTLRRVRMDATERETLLVIDAPIAGTDLRPSHIYPLSTIRSDGDSLALSCFLRDGERDDLPWGLMVFDLRAATVRVVLQGTDWINIHPQYSRSLDPVAKHDILVQQNHGYFHDPGDGAWRFSHNSTGADIHVIRDDGSNFPQHALGARWQRVLPGAPVLDRAVDAGHHVHRHAPSGGAADHCGPRGAVCRARGPGHAGKAGATT